MSDPKMASVAEQLSIELWNLVTDAAQGGFEGKIKENEAVQDFAGALIQFAEYVISAAGKP